LAYLQLLTKKETVRAYFAGWLPERRAQVEEVTTKFWGTYHEIAAELFPPVRRTGDRFPYKTKLDGVWRLQAGAQPSS